MKRKKTKPRFTLEQLDNIAPELATHLREIRKRKLEATRELRTLIRGYIAKAKTVSPLNALAVHAFIVSAAVKWYYLHLPAKQLAKIAREGELV